MPAQSATYIRMLDRLVRRHAAKWLRLVLDVQCDYLRINRHIDLGYDNHCLPRTRAHERERPEITHARDDGHLDDQRDGHCKFRALLWVWLGR